MRDQAAAHAPLVVTAAAAWAAAADYPTTIGLGPLSLSGATTIGLGLALLGISAALWRRRPGAPLLLWLFSWLAFVGLLRYFTSGGVQNVATYTIFVCSIALGARCRPEALPAAQRRLRQAAWVLAIVGIVNGLGMVQVYGPRSLALAALPLSR